MLEARPFQDTIADAGREQRGGQINTNRVLLHLLRRQGEKEIVPFFAITPELLPFQPKEQENQAQAAPQAQKPFSCDYGQQNHQLQNTPPWNQ